MHYVQESMSALYLTWWAISDVEKEIMNDCEVMSSPVCNKNYLKPNDYRL